jgi:hypothetical protein
LKIFGYKLNNGLGSAIAVLKKVRYGGESYAYALCPMPTQAYALCPPEHLMLLIKAISYV